MDIYWCCEFTLFATKITVEETLGFISDILCTKSFPGEIGVVSILYHVNLNFLRHIYLKFLNLFDPKYI